MDVIINRSAASETSSTSLVKSDFDSICRLCLSRDRPHISLFSHGQGEIPLYLIAQTCATVDIDEDDGLPRNICYVCRHTILSSYQFREQVGHNDRILRCIAGMKPDPENEGLNAEAEVSVMLDEPSWNPVEATGAGRSNSELKLPDSIARLYSTKALTEDEGLQGTGDHFLLEKNCANADEEGIYIEQCKLTDSGGTVCTNGWSNLKNFQSPSDGKLLAKVEGYGTPDADGSGYCFECEKIFCRFYDHVQLKHLFTDAFWCDQCDVLCKSKDDLARHIERVHFRKRLRSGRPRAKNGSSRKRENSAVGRKVSEKMIEYGTRLPNNRSYYCKLCKKFLSNRNRFRTHIKLKHLQIRDFMCDQCGYRALTKSHLIQHIDGIHLRVKKFKCPNCPLRFCTYQKLCEHKRIHQPGGIRKVMCEVCGKSL